VKKAKVKFDNVAVAIKYAFGADGEAPKIVASGRGFQARQIVDLAEKHKVPLREDRSLAQSLAQVPVGVEIPAELWGAMAEILAQIYLLDRRQQA